MPGNWTTQTPSSILFSVFSRFIFKPQALPTQTSLCTFVWVRLGLKDNPSPDPAQCGKPTALGTPSLWHQRIKLEDDPGMGCLPVAGTKDFTRIVFLTCAWMRGTEGTVFSKWSLNRWPGNVFLKEIKATAFRRSLGVCDLLARCHAYSEALFWFRCCLCYSCNTMFLLHHYF